MQRPDSLRRTTAFAALIAAGALGLIVFDDAVRRMEAATSAQVVTMTGVHAGVIGTAVVFANDGRLIGYGLTAGCSVAFLLAPLFLLVAGLVLAGRFTLRKAALLMVVLTALLFTVNQL